MTVRRKIARERVPRKAYLVIRAGLARLARRAGLVGSVTFVNRACRARLACLARNSRTTSDEARIHDCGRSAHESCGLGMFGHEPSGN